MIAAGDAERLSVVVPCYGEEDTLPVLHERLTTVLVETGREYEIVYVDDGSPDGTRAVLRKLAEADSRVRWLGFSRNFGHQAALTAGLAEAAGEFVISMDGDLQHPPEVIPELIAAAAAGAAIVVTRRLDAEGTSWFKRTTSRWFYGLISTLGQVQMSPGSSDFRLLTRPALDALLAMPERHRFLRGMVAWSGFRSDTVTFQADERFAGESTYTLRRMIKFAIDALISFSTFPLRAAAMVGMAIVSVAAVYGIYAVYAHLVLDATVEGWTSLLITVLFLGGTQLLTLGLLGEYIARVYDEVKARPLYLIEERGGGETD